LKGGVVHARKLRGRPDNACREAIERSVKISAPSGSHPLPGAALPAPLPRAPRGGLGDAGSLFSWLAEFVLLALWAEDVETSVIAEAQRPAARTAYRVASTPRTPQ
jgi:hypothetical protein